MQALAPCPRCGRPVAYGALSCVSCGSPMSWVAPGVGPQRSSAGKTVAIVLAVIAVIIVVVVIVAAVLYVMVSELNGTGGTTRPTVSLVTSGTGLGCTGTTICTARIAAASQQRELASYNIRVFANGTALGAAQPLAASLTFGALTFTYLDLGGEGGLGSGDTFSITRTPVLLMNTEYTVAILWAADSALIADATFNT